MSDTSNILANARKAVFVFLGTLATNAAMDLMQDGHPFPTNWGDAARWLLSITLLTAGTYGIKPGRGIVTPPAVSRGLDRGPVNPDDRPLG